MAQADSAMEPTRTATPATDRALRTQLRKALLTLSSPSSHLGKVTASLTGLSRSPAIPGPVSRQGAGRIVNALRRPYIA